MTMKMITAKDQFDYAVWKILDGIEMQRLLHHDKKVIDYSIDIDKRNLAQSHFHDVIRFLKKSKAIKVIGKPDEIEIGKRGTTEHKVHETYHFKLLSKFNDFYRKYSNLVNGEIDSSKLFGFDNETFWLKTPDGLKQTINFGHKVHTNTPQAYYLLRVFIQQLKTGEWNRNGDWLEVKLTQKQIIDEVKKLNYKHPERLNNEWISNVKSNLLTKSIPITLQELIKINDYERKSQSYTFTLKISP